MATDDDQNERIRENREAIRAIEAKVNSMETDVAVVQSEVVGLRSTVTTGFTDLKEVIVARAEADAAERARAHELAVTANADRKALYMKALGLVATALTIAGGGGGALYAMSADKPTMERPPIAAPVVP
jgi:predicted phage tail protein